MIKLEDLLDFLNEAKQVGDLYHFTPLSNLKNILATRLLYPNDESQISVTRRPNMSTKEFQDMETSPILRITLDGDKISNKYKIRPFAFGANENDPEDLGEEQIIVNGEKFYFIPYLKRVDLFLNKKKEINAKSVEFLEKTNIPYKIYQGTPTSNTPYNQPKDGNPEGIDIEKIPKKIIYSPRDMYYPDMKFISIKLSKKDNFDPRPGPKSLTVAISPKYPNYYLLAGFKNNEKYYDYRNLKGEKINIEVIPIPMYNDPKWRKMWKTNVESPYNHFDKGSNADSYFLFPKNEI
jgi:hypothetical protein